MKRTMKTFEWSVTIASLVGTETRRIETVGRTQGAAEKRLRALMGNRSFDVNWVRDIRSAGGAK